MSLSPPRSTPFPYTTLFRSDIGGDRAGRGPERRRQLHRAQRRVTELPRRSSSLDRFPQAPPRLPSPRPPSRQARTSSDRKSTRLNSSHTVISYAVFCLKKKK